MRFIKGSIQAKILTVSLSVCVTSLLLSTIISIIHASFLTSLASHSGRDIGVRASENSESLLLEQAVANVADLVTGNARNINLHLSGFITLLESMRDYSMHLYKQKDGPPARMIPTTEEIIAAGHGKDLTLHLKLSSGTEYGEVLGEIGFFGNMEPVLRAAMENWSQITSIYITTESGLNIGYDAYAQEKGGVYEFDGRTSPWYRSAIESGGLYISDAYQDIFGRGLTITLSLPLTIDELSGVIGMDILIEDLKRDIIQTAIWKTGYAMLIGHDGSMISAPGLSEQGECALSRFGVNGESILTSILAGERGVQNSQIEGTEILVVYTPVGISDWALAFVIPLEDITMPAIQVRNIIDEIITQAESGIASQTAIAAVTLAVLFSTVIVVAVWIILKLSEQITQPLLQLCKNVKSIGDGNLDYTCGISTGDELEELDKAFEAMTIHLKQYIHNLAEITADKERIAAELDVAARIQAGMLPQIFPEREEFGVYATMLAATEVGGDFYDFFLLEGNRLAVIIGDVSGKGIPAALFMVIAKTLIGNYCRMGLKPAAALEEANNQLCENNEEGLFVTVFLGMLELDTGRFHYANAGHNPPAIYRRGQWEWLDASPGFVLAGFEGMRYVQQETELSDGDRLLLYTDGVTEAQDREEKLYSEERLMSLLGGVRGDCGAQRIVSEITADIGRFAEGAPQADDITMLALEYFDSLQRWKSINVNGASNH